jgi:two-component sensor histidine kinase
MSLLNIQAREGTTNDIQCEFLEKANQELSMALIHEFIPN